MAISRPFSVQHWRNRAAETRRLADAIEDSEAKRIILEIAEGYERLARHAGTGREDKGA